MIMDREALIIDKSLTNIQDMVLYVVEISNLLICTLVVSCHKLCWCYTRRRSVFRNKRFLCCQQYQKKILSVKWSILIRKWLLELTPVALYIVFIFLNVSYSKSLLLSHFTLFLISFSPFLFISSMAYAALLSLSQTLDLILIHEQYPHLFEKEKLVSLNINVSTLVAFLEEYSQKCPGDENPLESRIITEAYHAEDIIESQYSSPILSKACIGNMVAFCISICWPKPGRNFVSFQKVCEEINLLLEEAMKIKDTIPAEIVSLSDAPCLSNNTAGDVNNVVFEDDFLAIKERIYNKSCDFDVIPIVGMGGIGKSTLARKLYEDSIKRGKFDKCVWIEASEHYSLRKILFEILERIGTSTIEDYIYSDDELKQVIYQDLLSWRFLVVVDDLGCENRFDDLNLPNGSKGSRVLVTTRLSEVASNVVGSTFCPPHDLQPLNEYQSWRLFAERVFGEVSFCSPELEELGKMVVKSCQGLPLTIVIIAGILKGNKTIKYWKSILENISSSEPTFSTKVLSMGYSHLPIYLKPCFLYASIFPAGYGIEVHRLVRLWIAEGFVKPNGTRRLEEVAEGYLHDLIGRGLIVISEKHRYSNNIKTVRIPDAFWDIAISNARDERFHYHYDLKREDRRVTTNDFFSFYRIFEFREPVIRSILIPYDFKDLRSFEKFRLLRVLDALHLQLVGDLKKLVRLRYLSACDVHYTLLKSISKLQNIQTLVIGDISGGVTELKIWTMTSLRHLCLPPFTRLKQPRECDITEESSLQTIRSVMDLRLTTQVVKMLQNLRKVEMSYTFGVRSDNVCYYQLNNLVHLEKLEKLTIRFLLFIKTSSPCFSELAFPKSLKKLILGDIYGPWEDMSRAVGSLPNLEVFKLLFFNTGGGAWHPIEGQFLKLKHLKLACVELDHWEAESVHFPRLEVLVLKSVKGDLNEIPSGIGEIDSLKVIKLADCEKALEDSAKQIQSDQREMGNEDIRVIFIASRYEGDEIEINSDDYNVEEVKYEHNDAEDTEDDEEEMKTEEGDE